ncbi:MAG: nucleotidyltransferase domain-containing protein [Armatimonadetes bacterium]|nr:nucleotidyltransferase domain-containing protein [Armatimonadota bacterium]
MAEAEARHKLSTARTQLPAAVWGAISVLIEAADPRCVVLFGSYAQGRPRPDSDLDLLFVVDAERSRDVGVELRKRWRALRRQRPELPILDLLAYTPQEFRENFVVGFVPYEALREGVVLYGRPPELGAPLDRNSQG